MKTLLLLLNFYILTKLINNDVNDSDKYHPLTPRRRLPARRHNGARVRRPVLQGPDQQREAAAAEGQRLPVLPVLPVHAVLRLALRPVLRVQERVRVLRLLTPLRVDVQESVLMQRGSEEK